MKKKKKKYFDELIKKFGGDPVDPGCLHYPDCGGCLFRGISYENQLLLKKGYLEDLFKESIDVHPVIPSGNLRYRNRMDMVTAFGKFGLRKRGSFKHVVEIESCAIMQERMDSIYSSIRPEIQKIEGYDYLIHEGYLRYLVLREGMFSGELMVNFVTAKRDNRLAAAIEKLSDTADSVSILFNDGLADQSFGEVIEIAKKGYIEEVFDDIKFRITPNSFFQSNSGVALNVYREIKKECRGKTLDLYSGVGSISLFAAENAESITGIESVPEAVENAKINASANNISNVVFHRADAVEYFGERGEGFDTVILDPPRSGMHPKMMKHINRIKPEKIIYMSCNPNAFGDEMALLEGYSIESFQGYDMFPFTPHIETLAVLKRK